MSDRLADLRRQRALIQEHLAWLDREIADAEVDDRAAPPASSPLTPRRTTGIAVSAPVGGPPVAPAESPAVAAAADAILSEYRLPPSALKSDVRKGCLLYFAGAFLVVIVGVAILYFALRRD